MVLAYLRHKRKANVIVRDPESTNAVVAKMDLLAFYRFKAKKILHKAIDLLNDGPKVDGRSLIDAMKLLKSCDDMILEISTKLAPYQTPKLETLEVKSQIEHRYVIRAPEQMKSTEEWMKATGAESQKIDKIQSRVASENTRPPVQSLHDFDDDEVEYYNKKVLN